MDTGGILFHLKYSCELKAIMVAMGEKVDDKEINEMIKIADKSGSGGVNFGDLEELMLD